MIAISVESPNKLAIEQDTRTKPMGDEVLARMRRGRICSSDTRILDGRNPIAHYSRKPALNN